MDSESAASRALGSWDPGAQLAPFYEAWTSSEPTPDFVVDDVWRAMVARLGFTGSSVTAETLSFWDATLKAVYSGDGGRRRLRMALINLVERDGLLLRLADIRCPVYWLQVGAHAGAGVGRASRAANALVSPPCRASRTPSFRARWPRRTSACLRRRPRRGWSASREAVTTSAPPALARSRRPCSAWWAGTGLERAACAGRRAWRALVLVS